MTEGANAAVFAELLAERGVGDEAGECRRQSWQVIGGDEQSVFFVFDCFGHSADGVGDDGQAVRASLQIDETESFDA